MNLVCLEIILRPHKTVTSPQTITFFINYYL